MSDSFTPKLGRIGWKQGTRLDRYINRVMRAAQAAGHVGGSSRGRFNGAHIGRGSAFGTLAGAGLYGGGQRRVIVKARITKLKRGDLGAARAHLSYIQRDGVTPDGEAGQLYCRDTDEANGTQFLDPCDGDRHQFRLIVSAEDANELADLRPFIRDLMQKAEADLGTKLDWVAVDHFNTGHPHTHIVIRGKNDQGDDLIVARDYMSHGFRMRARELVTLELGPEIESDMTLKLAREVEAERFTRLDRALLDHTKRGYLAISAMPPTERQTHAAHLGRLRKLEQLGLVREFQTGVWEISTEIEEKLKSIGTRSDIRHKDQVVHGQHQAIIDRELWEVVQEKLKGQARQRASATNRASGSLLAGLLFDETGDRLTPSQAIKDGRRYRYYISQRLMQERKKGRSGWRLPACEMEVAVLSSLCGMLGDPNRLHRLLNLREASIEVMRTTASNAVLLVRVLTDSSLQARALLLKLVARIDIAPRQMRITFTHGGLQSELGIEIQAGEGGDRSSETVLDSVLTLPFEIRRRGVEARLVVGNVPRRPAKVDGGLVDAIGQARRWLHQLNTAGHPTIANLAHHVGVDNGEISRLLPLAFLAPDIVEAILEGRQPVELTRRKLIRLKPLPVLWANQRLALGFQQS
ncbi:MAG: DUF3363 domain-containing protein [Aestuariivirga sp.]